MSYQVYVVLGSSGVPYPCTISTNPERTKQLAETAFCATWAALVVDGFKIHSATLMIGEKVQP